MLHATLTALMERFTPYRDVSGTPGRYSGSIDPVLPLAHGEHTASLISDSQLQVIDGMGNSLEPVLIPSIGSAIRHHIQSSETGRDSGEQAGRCTHVLD